MQRWCGSLLSFLTVAHVAWAKQKPNLVFMLIDDLGWNDVSYHEGKQEEDTPETPNFEQLTKEGVTLRRAYSYAWCAPARASILSGRLSVHVDCNHTDSLVFNPDDPISGSTGVPTGMTMISGKLKKAGYKCHYNGKWGVGWTWPTQMPLARGFDSYLGYLHDSSDYWTNQLPNSSIEVPTGCEKHGINGIVDLWKDDGPAYGLNGTMWADYLFLRESLKNIEEHDPSVPFFLFHAFHAVHSPLDPPQVLQDKYRHFRDPSRRGYAALTSFADQGVGEVVEALKKKGMWENTILVVSSDNGGPTYAGKNLNLFGGASNYPLRGGKTSDFEGGIRVNSFVSGGLLPAEVRGMKLDDYVHVADWYATFCELAGVPVHDTLAESYGLPAVDSLSMWPVLSGQVPAGQGPRTEIHVSVATLVQGRWKLLTGSDPGSINTHLHPGIVPFDSYRPGYGPGSLLNTAALAHPPYGLHCFTGCLFDIMDDPTEQTDRASEEPEVLARMWARLKELNTQVFVPDRGENGPVHLEVCHEMQQTGFYHPYARASGKGLAKIKNNVEAETVLYA